MFNPRGAIGRPCALAFLEAPGVGMMVADRHLANEHVERFLSAEIVARFFLAQTTILVRSSLQRTMRSGAALRSHEKGYSAL